MIRSERRRRITEAQVRRFEQALADLRAAPPNPGIAPRLRQAEMDGLHGQLDDLRQELAQYDALRRGERSSQPVATLDELPSALIRARIAAGLTQRDLAESLGLKEQQIQRYEATDYASASLARVQLIARRLGVTMQAAVQEAASA